MAMAIEVRQSTGDPFTLGIVEHTEAMKGY